MLSILIQCCLEVSNDPDDTVLTKCLDLDSDCRDDKYKGTLKMIVNNLRQEYRHKGYLLCCYPLDIQRNNQYIQQMLGKHKYGICMSYFSLIRKLTTSKTGRKGLADIVLIVFCGEDIERILIVECHKPKNPETMISGISAKFRRAKEIIEKLIGPINTKEVEYCLIYNGKVTKYNLI